MARLTLIDKLAILSDAAKYDASCASSGSTQRDSSQSKGIGSTGGSGICHAYAPDGRCISLLKILMTNFCIYDCVYCVNRSSSNVARARFTVEEVVELTMSFYRRNYIEGLFLSSGIIRNSDYTMEEMVRIARKLRLEENFCRLHPPEDDPRRLAGADRGGRALRRPAVDQHRTADRRHAGGAAPRRRSPATSAARWGTCA